MVLFDSRVCRESMCNILEGTGLFLKKNVVVVVLVVLWARRLCKQGDTSGAVDGPIEAEDPIEWEPSDNYALVSHLGSGKVNVTF